MSMGMMTSTVTGKIALARKAGTGRRQRFAGPEQKQATLHHSGLKYALVPGTTTP
ncbi:MAG: hypothetical protein P8Z31_05870 [Gammaproteobacteria bacterium]|jgi:hypothetical protein